nr:hypothetical protein BaRGS_004180 [Batillaria attramentaria]
MCREPKLDEARRRWNSFERFAAALSMHPTLQQNGQRMPLTSQSSSGSIVADMPSEAYEDMSDGVYVEPLGHRPPSERQPQGRAGKITSDSTYIAMGACGPPPSPQGEPTPPDQLDKEGERDEVYTEKEAPRN